MLVQYNHLSELTSADLQRLKVKVMNSPVGGSPVFLDDKVFPLTEIMAQKKIWEAETQLTSKKILLG